MTKIKVTSRSTQDAVDKIIDTDTAWVSGLFEGEGCIQFVGKNGVNLNITSTDEDVILRVQSLLGGYVYGPRTRKNSTKPFWEWQLRVADDVQLVLCKMLPCLCVRRAEKAHAALFRLQQIFSNRKDKKLIDHGTWSGYSKEKYRGIQHCGLCLEFYNAYQQERRK